MISIGDYGMIFRKELMTMRIRFDTLLFPGGKSKAFTLSYDDGVVQDRRLAELFRKYGLKCSFNLGSGVLGHRDARPGPGGKEIDVSKVSPEEVPQVYREHEICGHGLYHSALNSIGTPLAMYEIIEDKRRLEAISGSPLKMFAYPFGLYNDKVVELLALAGYQGARTVHSTHGFDIPEDFLRWDPTCHHDDEKLMELARQFVEGVSFGPMLFYVWGHAYEFDGKDNWQRIEELAEFMSRYADSVWFASNGEIIDYVNAYRRLEYASDGLMIYNPSAQDVFLRLERTPEVTVLPAGKVTRLEPTGL